MNLIERKPTPYAVVCKGPWDLPGHGHGKVYLTQEEYNYQMNRPNKLWKCPICNCNAIWDDDNYENYLDEQEEKEANEHKG